MEVLQVAAAMVEVTMAEEAINQEPTEAAMVIHVDQEDIHIIQDIIRIMDTAEVMVAMVDTVAMVEDQDGHITGDQDVDSLVVNIGTGITVDGFHTGHFPMRFRDMGSIRK